MAHLQPSHHDYLVNCRSKRSKTTTTTLYKKGEIDCGDAEKSTVIVFELLEYRDQRDGIVNKF